MGKKKKGKKKSKEELEEEARIAAEEAAKAAEEARIAAEEKAKRLAEEHRLRQEFLLNERNEELARLVNEEGENADNIRSTNNSIENSIRNILENEEWQRYSACLDIPDPLKEGELNTFMSTWVDDDNGDLKSTLNNCQRAELVCKEANTYLARSKGAGDKEKAAYFEKYMGLLRDTQLDKIDFSTANVINNAEDYANDKRACQVQQLSENGLKYGLWVNLAKKPFRLKVVDFHGTGMSVDIPKPLALQSVALRALYLPFTHIKGMEAYTGNDNAIGGVIHLDMLRLPKPARRVKDWQMTPISQLTNGVERMHYPPGASPHDHAASLNAQPFRVKVTMPKTLVVPAEPRVCYWNNVKNEWSNEGIHEITFDPPSRLLSFQTTKLTPIAILQSRQTDLPFERWSIKPTSLNTAEATFEAKRFNINITVDGPMCILTGPKQGELENLIGKKMEPGQLFTELKLRGINLCPTDEDASNCFQEGSAEAPIVIKNQDLETKALNDISTVAGAFAIGSSVWNQKRGSSKCVFRILEKAGSFDDGSGEVSPRGSENGDEGKQQEEEDWKTVLYELDEQKAELETKVEEPTLSNGVKCTFVDITEADSDWTSKPEPGAVSHAYMNYSLQGKCTPEALDVIRETSSEYTATIRSLLILTRVLSFS
jgi:cancer susceptibility candidate protein 1